MGRGNTDSHGRWQEKRTPEIRWLGGVKEITQLHLREPDVMEWRNVARRDPDVGFATEARRSLLLRSHLLPHA